MDETKKALEEAREIITRLRGQVNFWNGVSGDYGRGRADGISEAISRAEEIFDVMEKETRRK